MEQLCLQSHVLNLLHEQLMDSADHVEPSQVKETSLEVYMVRKIVLQELAFIRIIKLQQVRSQIMLGRLQAN